MKIRNGFVSNSSSSSYIMVLPIEFDFEKDIDIEKFVEVRSKAEYDDDVTFEECEEYANRFIKDGYISTHDEEYEYFNIICDLFGDYELTSVEGGSDGGDSITLIKTSVILEKIGLNEKDIIRLMRKQKLENVKGENKDEN